MRTNMEAMSRDELTLSVTFVTASLKAMLFHRLARSNQSTLFSPVLVELQSLVVRS